MYKKILFITGLALLISFGLSYAAEKAVVDIFSEADSDKDGYINPEEARKANLLNDHKFYEADADQDGILSLGEAKQALSAAPVKTEKDIMDIPKEEPEVSAPQIPASAPEKLEQAPLTPPLPPAEIKKLEPPAQQKKIRPRPRMPYGSNRNFPPTMNRPPRVKPPQFPQPVMPAIPSQNAN